MVKHILPVIFVIAAFLPDCKAQQKFLHTVEAGTLVSIGKNKSETRTVIRDNTVSSITYPKVLKFTHPSLRLRYSILYNAASNYFMGIETGVTVRYREPYYDDEHLFSFPAVAKFQYNLFAVSHRSKFLLEACGGYSFMKITNGPVTEKGGWIYHGGLGINLKSGNYTTWKLSTGYERQEEKMEFDFRSPGTGGQDWSFTSRRFRNQVYISIAFSF